MMRIAALMIALATCSPIADASSQQAPQRRRIMLEGDIEREFARVVQQRVGLTDAQMTRLAPVTRKHAEERRRLQLEERNVRVELQSLIRQGREGTQGGSAGSQGSPATDADSARISGLLARLVDMQKRRALIFEAEQRELAGIMTPLQRARFVAMQEQLRRRVEQRRGQDSRPPGRRPPP